MASSPKSKTRSGAEELKDLGTEALGIEGKGVLRERFLQAFGVAPSVMLAIEDALRADHPLVTGSESAEASMLQDIDAILSRLDDGIVKERKAMDDLFERIRRRAA
jgi:hypothetical protein